MDCTIGRRPLQFQETLANARLPMFKTYEPGATCRIRHEGRSVEGEIIERRGTWYTFRYRDERGQVKTGRVTGSQIMGRIFVAPATSSPSESPIARGEWYLFQDHGKERAGVVYRIEGDRYTLFYLSGNTAKAVVLSREELGAKHEGMTAVFREEMARNPNYLEKWVATLTRDIGRQESHTSPR